MLARRQGGAAPGDVLADEEPGRRRRQAPASARCSAGCPPASGCTSSATASAPAWCRTRWPGCRTGPSPVKSVTLLQGAFSHFAFARPLPFDAGRNGALAGMLARIDGPLTACFSSHDRRGRPVLPAGLAGRPGRLGRRRRTRCSAGAAWARTGRRACRPRWTRSGRRRPARRTGSRPGKALNIDASEVVRAGGPPERRAQRHRPSRVDLAGAARRRPHHLTGQVTVSI